MKGHSIIWLISLKTYPNHCQKKIKYELVYSFNFIYVRAMIFLHIYLIYDLY